MIKATFFLLGMLHLSLSAMEGNEEFRPSEWRTRKLQTLLDEAKSPTCNQRIREIRELKKEFVHQYLDTYNEQQEILSDLMRETQGVICATTDPELAKEDSNKFLCLDPFECTADEIDARWQRIHRADCKNMESHTAATQN
ncbi:MAG: hypothetical protein AMXMBFR12_01130 [Candidatus Babeliales bacterium]